MKRLAIGAVGLALAIVAALLTVPWAAAYASASNTLTIASVSRPQ